MSKRSIVTGTFGVALALISFGACSSPSTNGSVDRDATAPDATPDGADDARSSVPDGSDASSTSDAADASETKEAGPSLRPGLVGYWPFDGDGADLSGAGRPLTLVGNPTFSTGVAGQSLTLTGKTSQYAVRATDDPEYDFDARDFTVSIWAKLATPTTEQTLVEKFSGQQGPGWTLTKLETGEGHFWTSPSAVLTSGNLALSAGTWHHFLARRRGTTFALIVDGVTVATETNASPVPDTSQPLLVGKRNELDGRGFPVNGSLDELAIWSRALGDEEVAFLWNGGVGRSVP